MTEPRTNFERAHRKSDRTPEELARIKAAREKLQRERPSLDDLIVSGDVETIMSQGEYFDLVRLLASLKSIRESAGLSLADIAARTGMDRAAISRLENGQVNNPTIGTLQTLAFGLGKRLVVRLEDV
jgi:DNA-binding XRE family transcriptional regulator